MIYAIVIPYDYKVERVIGVTLTILTISSLLCTALSDPGIFPRYVKPLGQNWTYSEYAQSYRPPGVIYCQHCRVLIEDYNRIRRCSSPTFMFRSLLCSPYSRRFLPLVGHCHRERKRSFLPG